MGEEFQSHLKEQPEIAGLFQVLGESGLTKEFQEVESLVNYLEGMEKQFHKVLGELKEVRGQLEQIQDKGIKAAAARIVGKAEEKVQEIGGKLTLVKENFIRSARHAVGIFHEKGVDALRKAVSAMKIPSALSLLKDALHSGVESMDKHAAKIAAVSGELHKAAEHTKNVGRALFVVSLYQVIHDTASARNAEEAFAHLAEVVEVAGEPWGKMPKRGNPQRGNQSPLEQYQKLFQQNNELAGWVSIEGTNINYPVMYTQEKPDFYLKHNFEKAYSAYGVPYIKETQWHQRTGMFHCMWSTSAESKADRSGSGKPH